MIHLIEDLAVLLLVSLPINLLFHKIKLPSVMGYLIAGVLIGPYGLQLIDNVDVVKHLAEIGVILLLFVIGLEFSLTRFIKNLASVLGVGGFQLILTAGTIGWIFHLYGFVQNQSIAFGLIIALSSTAIVLKMITDRAEIDTLHGKLCWYSVVSRSMRGPHYASYAFAGADRGYLIRRLNDSDARISCSGCFDILSV